LSRLAGSGFGADWTSLLLSRPSPDRSLQVRLPLRSVVAPVEFCKAPSDRYSGTMTNRKIFVFYCYDT
jgi:hypothetical protein